MKKTALVLFFVFFQTARHLLAQVPAPHAPAAAATRNDISLREYAETLLAAERRERILQQENAALALKLQAAEYERRLEALNHEADQLKEMKSNYAPRESFEMTSKDVSKEIEEIKRRLASSDAENAAGRRWIGVSMVALTALFAALSFFRRPRPLVMTTPEPGMERAKVRR